MKINVNGEKKNSFLLNIFNSWKDWPLKSYQKLGQYSWNVFLQNDKKLGYRITLCSSWIQSQIFLVVVRRDLLNSATAVGNRLTILPEIYVWSLWIIFIH